MDHLNDNLSLLKLHQPQAYRALQSYYVSRKNQPEAAQLTPFANCDFCNLTYIDDQGQTKILYDSDPLQSFDNSLKQSSNLNRPALLVIYGFALGYHILKLAETHFTYPKHILIIEKQPSVFAQALKINNFAKLLNSPKITILVGCTTTQLTTELKKYLLDQERLIQSNNMGTFFHLPSLTHDGSYYVECAKILDSTLGQLADLYTAPAEDNMAALHNILRNTDQVQSEDYFISSANTLSGEPAVLVGAGPSLEPLLPTLKANQHKIFIAAVDAVLPTLFANEIKPDLVICAERVRQQAWFFESLPMNCTSNLVTLPTVHPDVLRLTNFPILFLPRLATYGAWLSDELSTDLGLGVSSVALQCLHILGCRVIYMLGQDFAFSRQTSQSYVSSSLDYLNHIQTYNETCESIQVSGNNGVDISTSPEWNKLRLELSQIIKSLTVEVYNVIDKDSGALIPGTMILEPENFADRLQALKNKILWQPNSTISKPNFMTLINKTSQYLKTLHVNCLDQINSVHDDFFERINGVRNPNDLNSSANGFIDSWDKSIETLIDLDRRMFYFFVNMTFCSQHLRLLGEREKIKTTKQPAYDLLFKHAFKTIEWIQNLDSWAVRLLDVLSEFEK